MHLNAFVVLLKRNQFASKINVASQLLDILADDGLMDALPENDAPRL
jgi:hypothetical protein